MAEDHWEGEDVIITFEEEGKDAVFNYEGKITNLSQTGGASSTENLYCFGGKTIVLNKPREKMTVSFDVIFTDPTFTHMAFGSTSSITAGKPGRNEVRSDQSPARWRIGMWFQAAVRHRKNSATPTIVVPLKTLEIYRIVYCDCQAVTFDKDMSADGVLKGTVSFELSSTDSDGYPNIFEQWTDTMGTSALATLTATAHKGTLTWATTAASAAWTGSYRT